MPHPFDIQVALQECVELLPTLLKTEPARNHSIGDLPHASAETGLIVVFAICPLMFCQELQKSLPGLEPQEQSGAENIIVRAIVTPWSTARVSFTRDVSKAEF